MSSASKRGFSLQDLITLYLSSLFLTLTVLFFSPMELILINARDFRFSFQDVWLLQLAVAVVSAGVLTGIILLFLRKTRLVFAALMTAGGLAVWIQMMFLNGNMIILTGEEMTVPRSTILVNAAIWAVIIAGMLFAVLRLKNRKTAHILLRVVGGALIVMQGAALITLIATNGTGNKQSGYILTKEGAFDFSPENNVIEIILDTADREYTDNMLEKYPELQESLSGWVYYPNAVSTYSRTYPALPYMLSGEKCWFDKETDDYIKEAFQKSAFLRTMKEQGTDIGIYAPDSTLLSDDAMQCLSNSVFTGDAKQHFVYYQLEKNIVRISLYKCMPYVLKGLFQYNVDIINLSSFDFRPFRQYLDPAFYGLLLGNGGVKTVEGGKASFRLYHLHSTHPGSYWDGDLKEADHVSKEDSLRGSFRVVEELQHELKEAGILDRTLIIVTADHGISDGDRDKFERDRASCPLLMVRYPDSDPDKPLAVNHAPVSHDDLFRTIYNALGISDGNTYGSGKALTDFSENEPRVRTHYFSAIDKGTREVALIEYEIDGDAYDFSTWHKTGKWWDILYSANPVSDRKYQGQ